MRRFTKTKTRKVLNLKHRIVKQSNGIFEYLEIIIRNSEITHLVTLSHILKLHTALLEK